MSLSFSQSCCFRFLLIPSLPIAQAVVEFLLDHLSFFLSDDEEQGETTRELYLHEEDMPASTGETQLYGLLLHSHVHGLISCP